MNEDVIKAIIGWIPALFFVIAYARCRAEIRRRAVRPKLPRAWTVRR